MDMGILIVKVRNTKLQIGFIIPVHNSCTTAMQNQPTNQTHLMQRRFYVMNRCFDAHVMQP